MSNCDFCETSLPSAATDAPPDTPPAAPSPQVGLRGTVGTGKTKTMIEAVRRVLVDPEAACAVFVPDHRLAEEFEARLRDELGPSVPVGIWRGLNQPDPNAPAGAGWQMCRRSADVALVSEAGGRVSDVCGSRRRGFCPHHTAVGGACGYIAQGQARNRVWVMPHAMLSKAAPDAMRRFMKDSAGNKAELPPADLVVIDESFWRALLAGTGARPFTINPSNLSAPVLANVPDHRGEIPDYQSKRLARVLGALANLIASTALGAAVDRSALSGAGFCASDLKDARVLAFRCKVPLPAGTIPGGAAGTVANVLGASARDNRVVMGVARLLEVAGGIAEGRLGPAALRVGMNRAGARSIILRWRDDIHDHWLSAPCGIIHADATMEESIVRRWLPHLSVPPIPAATPPHMRVIQVDDRVLGYTAVLESSNPSPRGKHAARENAQRVRRVIDELSVRYAGRGGGGPDVLVILPAKLEAEFLQAVPPLPANVGMLHFNKLRGQDGYKDVGAILIVSRPLPGPAAAEDDAEIIFGVEVGRVAHGKFYPKMPAVRVMADGTARTMPKGRSVHPDARAEAVRKALCEAELVQAIGRGRGVHRTASNPLDVIVLTNVPLNDVPVTETCTLDDIWRVLAGEDPVLAMLKAGVMPRDWPGVGEVLVALGVFPRVTNQAEATRRRFDRDGVLKAGLLRARREVLGTATAKGGRMFYIDAVEHPSAFCGSGPWPLYAYRRANCRRAERVLIDPRHSDPKAAAEALLGPLTMFAPAVPKSATAKRAATTAPIPGPTAPPDLTVQPRPPGIAVQPTAPTPKPRHDAPQDLAPVGEAPGISTVADRAIAGLEAEIASVRLGLPPVLDALVRRGVLPSADRKRHLNRFRIDRGSHEERERRALTRLTVQVGPVAITAAAREAAFAALGLRMPGAPPAPTLPISNPKSRG